MTRKPVYLAALAATLALPLAARADDHGHGHGHGHDKHKEKYWDGNCEVERKWKHGEWEEKRKCRAPERIVVVPAPAPQTVVVVPAPAPQAVVVYPPWIVRQHNEYVYEPRYQPAPQRVVTGTYQCNSATVGRVLGGIVGGTLGNQVGQGNGRTAATIGGAVAGVLVGGEIGRRMDAGRQGCVGQVLEIAPVNQRVQWVEGPTNYVVVPGKVISRSGGHCRPYTVEMRMNGHVERTNGTACRRPDGVWVAA
jgi:surface antigen